MLTKAGDRRACAYGQLAKATTITTTTIVANQCGNHLHCSTHITQAPEKEIKINVVAIRV